MLEKLGLWSDGKDDPPAKPTAPAPEAPRYETRVVSLQTLKKAREVAHRDVESGAAAATLALETTPEEIYELAGLPAEGWTLPRLGQELKEGDQLQLVLAEHKVAPEALLEDGFNRDRALDLFEESLDSSVQAYLEAASQKAALLEAEAREIASRAARIRDEQASVKARLEAWREKKHQTEDELERLAGLVAPLINKEAPRFSTGRKIVAPAPSAESDKESTVKKTPQREPAPEAERAVKHTQEMEPVVQHTRGPEEAEAAPWAPPALTSDEPHVHKPLPPQPAGYAPPIIPEKKSAEEV
ncbi:hypothetical protein DYH09_12570 [bacterium CPR1]|nr:hypothetical protein [bacterium CPR1]